MKTIAVDLDATLAQYKQYISPKVIGNPLPGAKEFLLALKAKGYRILIFSARTTPRHKEGGKYTTEELVANVENWFKKHDLYYDAIHSSDAKPSASCFVDDRAVECRPQENPDAYAQALENIKKIAGK